jgi:phosphoglycolate phosphatase-like HAD superfamily hydrolase
MSENGIPGRWIYANASSIPPKAFVNAVIVTDDGQKLRIRYWDSYRAGAPQVLVEPLFNSTLRGGPYPVKGFDNGFFKSLIPSSEFKSVFVDLAEKIERQRIAEQSAVKYTESISSRAGPDGESRSSVREQARQLKLQKEADRQRIRSAARQERLLEESSQRKSNVETAARTPCANSTLNETRKFDLLIFDLDDTLLHTEHLEAFRGKEFTGTQSIQYKTELANHAGTLDYLISEDSLLELQRDFPDLALSVFTRSPRDYAFILIEACYPRIRWSCIVTFEDVIHTKPRPDGIYLAAKKAGNVNRQRIAMVGDGKSDILAAYQAGVHSVLFKLGWGANWSSKGNVNRGEHFKTLNLMPDAILASDKDLIKLVTRPISLLPCLEAWDADPAFNHSAELMRVDTHKHFNNLADAGYPNWIEIHAMGRYFPAAMSSGWYDFSKREEHHLVTKAILDAKDGIPYPESWAECCANYISGYAREIHRLNLSLIACAIPSSSGSVRPQGRDRLVELFSEIEVQVKGRCNVTLDCEVLKYAPGASSNKTLHRDDRFANVRDHLFVANPSAVQGMAVLVIDDVSTSGATFFYAARYLLQAGAYSVRCLALTQTIS